MMKFIALTLLAMLQLAASSPAYAWGPVAHMEANRAVWERERSHFPGSDARHGTMFIDAAPMPDMISNYHIQSRYSLSRREEQSAFDYVHNLFSSESGRMLSVDADDNSRGLPLFGLFMEQRAAGQALSESYALGWTAHQLADAGVHGSQGMAERIFPAAPALAGALGRSTTLAAGRHGCFELAVDAVKSDALEGRRRAEGRRDLFDTPVIPWLIHEASLDMLRGLPPSRRAGFRMLNGENLIRSMADSYNRALNGRIKSVLPGSVILARRIRNAARYAEIEAFYSGRPLLTYALDRPEASSGRRLYNSLPRQLMKEVDRAGMSPEKLSGGTYLERYDYRLPFGKSIDRMTEHIRNPQAVRIPTFTSVENLCALPAADLYGQFALELTQRAHASGALQSSLKAPQEDGLAVYELNTRMVDEGRFDLALKETLTDWLGSPLPSAEGEAAAAASMSRGDYRLARRYLALVIEGLIYHPELTYAAVLRRADQDLERRAGGFLEAPRRIPPGTAPVLLFNGMPRPDPFRPLLVFIDGVAARPIMLPDDGRLVLLPASPLTVGRHVADCTAVSEAGALLSRRIVFSVAERGFTPGCYAYVRLLEESSARLSNPLPGSIVRADMRPGYSLPLNHREEADYPSLAGHVYVIRNLRRSDLSSLDRLRAGETFYISGHPADCLAFVPYSADESRESLLPWIFAVALLLLLLLLFRRRRRRAE